MSDKVILIIMDGWGIGDDNKVSAVHAATTPCRRSSPCLPRPLGLRLGHERSRNGSRSLRVRPLS